MLANLKAIRTGKSMTQKRLAELTGVHRVNIAKYEAGKSSPTLKTAEKLASALGVTVSDLIAKAG